MAEGEKEEEKVEEKKDSKNKIRSSKKASSPRKPISTIHRTRTRAASRRIGNLVDAVLHQIQPPISTAASNEATSPRQQEETAIAETAATSIITGEDRIGELPDEILHHILSFVPTHIAVRTSVLSRRWRRVWASVPILDFDRSAFREALGFFMFVDQVLFLRENLPVLRFRFSWPRGIADDRLLQYATGHGVRELEFDVTSLRFEEVFNCLSTCHSLEVLELHLRSAIPSVPVLRVPETVTLARLRILILWGVTISRDHLARLANNAPMLEDLCLSRCVSDAYNMTLPTVKNLFLEDSSVKDSGPYELSIVGPELRWLLLDFRNGDEPSSIQLSVPRLTRFDYYGARKMKSFVGELPYLSEALVYICLGPGVPGYDASQIFRGLCNVTTLTLSMSAFKYLNKEPGYLPVFSNLMHLKILLNMTSKMDLTMEVIQVIKDLFKLSPKLKYLKIESGETAHFGVGGGIADLLELLETLCTTVRDRGGIATLSLT